MFSQSSSRSAGRSVKLWERQVSVAQRTQREMDAHLKVGVDERDRAHDGDCVVARGEDDLDEREDERRVEHGDARLVWARDDEVVRRAPAGRARVREGVDEALDEVHE